MSDRPDPCNYYIRDEGYATDRLLLELDDRRLLEHMGVPRRFHSYAMRMTDLPVEVDSWLDSMAYIFRPQNEKQDEKPDLFGMGLLLHGPPGTRKTTTAAAILLRAVRLNWPNADPTRRSRWYGAAMGRFVSWQEVSALFRESMRDEDLADELARVKKSMKPLGPMEDRGDFLVIDDISRERATEYNISQLAQLLRHRHEWGYPTILTTNHDPSDWAVVYGEVMANFMKRSLLPVEMS